MPKKDVVPPKVAELKPLVRAFWQDAFEWKQGFEQLMDEELIGDFGRALLFKQRLKNLKTELNEIDKLLRGKEE